MLNWEADYKEWFKKNVPEVIKVRKDYINTFLNEDVRKPNVPYVGNGFNSDGESWITFEVLNQKIDIPLIIVDDLKDNYEQVFKIE